VHEFLNSKHSALYPNPYTLHTNPCTLIPVSYTLYICLYLVHEFLNSTNSTVFPNPYTLHTNPYTLHTNPYTLHTNPYTRIPVFYILYTSLYLVHEFLTSNRQCCQNKGPPRCRIPTSLHPTHWSLHPNPCTFVHEFLNSKHVPYTLIPTPYTLIPTP